MVARPNCGQGVPCTITRIGAELVPPPPEPTPMKDRYAADVKGRSDKCVLLLREVIGELRTALSAGTVGKTALKGIVRKLESAAGAVDDGIPFVAEQFEEAMEEVVRRASVEIEATVTNLAMRLGVERLREISASPMLALPEAEVQP